MPATPPPGPRDPAAEAPRSPAPSPTTPHPFGTWLGAGLMGLLVLITLANVVARYFVSHSFAWTEELSVFLMVVMTLVGSAWAARSDAHIRVELFYSRGSPGQRRALALVSGLATAALFVLLAVLLARTGLSEYEYQETTTGLGVPRWWYTAALPLLSLAVAVAALRCLVRGAPPAPADDERAP